MSRELEEERNALLERMHASRHSYRSELVHVEEPEHTTAVGAFPRSRTFKFIARHPYYASLGLLAALSVIPRKPLGRAVKGGIALTAGMLGNRAKDMMVRQLLPSAVHWLRSRNRVR